jgi:3-keto-disaccharide hydrolase
MKTLSRVLLSALIAASFSTTILSATGASSDRPSKSIDVAAHPINAIVLFDGSNLDAFFSQKTKSWEESDGPADWKILDGGILEVVPDSGSLITKRRFGDMKLHVEYRLNEPDTNGGVFLMCRYEIGIKNVDGDGPQPGCAFENLQQPARPIAPALKPGNEWQVLDVDFRAPRLEGNGKTLENARATVLLNGIKIHDNVELGPRKGAAKRLGDAAEAPLMLQEHGTAYQFRNIWVVDRAKGAAKDGQQ